MSNLIKIGAKDFVIVWVLPAFVSLILINYKFAGYNYLYSFTLFFGLPSLYLAYKKPSAIARAFMFGLFAFGFNFIFEFMALTGNAWINISGFPTLWGGVGIEALLCAFMLAFFMGLFFENYLKIEKVKGDSKKFLATFIPFLIVVVAICFIDPSIYKWTYYIIAAGFGVVPLIYVLLNKPHRLLLPSMILMGCMYAIPLLLLDMMNLSQGWMIFEGIYIYTANVFGYLIPLEEIIFFIILIPAASVLYYHYVFKASKS